MAPFTEIQICQATPGDIESIARLERDVSEEAAWLPYSQDLMLALCKYTHVLVVDGSVGGFCIHHMLSKSVVAEMERHGFYFRPGQCVDTCHITNIAVRKDLRKRGLGQRLVKAALKKHPAHKYVRYTYQGGVEHCIEKVLRSRHYTVSGKIVKEYVYSNGNDAMRHVFKKPA